MVQNYSCKVLPSKHSKKYLISCQNSMLYHLTGSSNCTSWVSACLCMHIQKISPTAVNEETGHVAQFKKRFKKFYHIYYFMTTTLIDLTVSWFFLNETIKKA